MKKFFLLFGVASSFVLFSSALAAEVDVDEILKKADNIRNPAESFFMRVEVADTGADARSVFEVSTGGHDKTFIRTLEPARDKWHNLLMLGDDMWAYIPNMKRSVRVSMNQKLSGQSANGDISRMRWYGDYSAKMEKQTDKEWILALSASRKGLTYDRILAKVDKATGRPVSAEYQTMAGKALKRATFGGYKMDAGAVRPHEILIQDAIRSKEVSTIRILQMQVKNFSASTFSQAALSE